MQNLYRRRNLSAIELCIGAAVIAVALFAWNQQSSVVDPDTLANENWRWQLWQIGTLVMAAAGAWWFWTNAQNHPRVRCLAMLLLALVIFINTYTDALFGDHVATVWAVADSLFIVLTAVVGLSLWRCGCASGRVLAVLSAAAGVCVFINYLFLSHLVLWSALDPIMMLLILVWAAAGLRPDIDLPGATPEDAGA